MKQRLSQLGFANYAEYLASELWIDFKVRYFAVHSDECAVCGCSGVQLHHVYYGRLGCERFDDIVRLCRHHHEAVHKLLEARHWPYRMTKEAVLVLRGDKKVSDFKSPFKFPWWEFRDRQKARSKKKKKRK